MRLTFPTRVSMTGVFIYAVFVFFAQQLQHTSAAFSVLYFGFVVLSGLSFNLANGFSTVVGSYVCWYWMFTCGLGVTLKIVFNQPADSNLAAPLLDMAVYTASMGLMIVVVYLLKRFDLRKYGLATSSFANFGDIDYSATAWGCLMLALSTLFLGLFFPAPPGSLLSVFNQVAAVFYLISMIFGTIVAIRQSGGRRTFSTVSVISMIVTFFFGFISYSKQGLMVPIVCWFVGAAYCKLRLRLSHYIFIALTVVFAAFFILPWSAGRDTFPDEGLTLQGQVGLALVNLQHFAELREQQAEGVTLDREAGAPQYFGESYGIFNRLTMIEFDDLLFAFTAKGHYVGYAPISGDFLNLVPHFIAPNKKAPTTGNTYAHEIGGILADEDNSTGISFTPSAEAFHIDGWTGILFLLPAIWILLFELIDLVVGDMKYTPWGLFVVVYFAHAASESALGGLIGFMSFGCVSLTVAILFGAKVAPLIGTALTGRARQISLGVS